MRHRLLSRSHWLRYDSTRESIADSLRKVTPGLRLTTLRSWQDLNGLARSLLAGGKRDRAGLN
ncbi:MAG: hypothetical protein AAFY20_10980 [Cyanobacteria bacterium J06639_14]